MKPLRFALPVVTTANVTTKIFRCRGAILECFSRCRSRDMLSACNKPVDSNAYVSKQTRRSGHIRRNTNGGMSMPDNDQRNGGALSAQSLNDSVTPSSQEGRGSKHSTMWALSSTLCLALTVSGAFAGDVLAQSASSFDMKLEQRVAGSAPMPRSMASIDATRPPTFVAADRVLLADGSVDPSLFRPAEVGIIQRHLALDPTNGCISLDMDSSDHLPANGGHPLIGDVIRESENVVVAEVTGRIYGYVGFDPGTLLRVETQETLWGGSYGESYLIHFPVGSFNVGVHRICRTTTGFPSPPEIGDRVLLLYNDIEFSTHTEFVNVRATDVVVLPKSGAVSFLGFPSQRISRSLVQWALPTSSTSLVPS